MAAPPRPKSNRGKPRPPTGAGLPSALHSDTSVIVQSIINEQAGAEEPPAPTRTVVGPGQAASWAPLYQLVHRPDNPRWAREYDPEQDPELAAFVKTLDEYDVLQSATVVSSQAWLEHHPEHADQLATAAAKARQDWLRHHPDDAQTVDADATVLVVLMGNRRLAGARHKALDGLPIFVNDKLADRRKSREAPIIENYQRTPFDPIREAAEMFAILEDTKESKRGFADRLGMSHTQVNQRLQLLNLLPEFQGMVSDQMLTVQKALPIAALDHDQQKALLELGVPYQVSRLAQPDEPTPDESGKTLSTTSAVTIRRHSTPTQIVDTLRQKLAPELLDEVLRLLRG